MSSRAQKILVATIVLIGVAGLIVVVRWRASGRTQRPNIVLIVIDTLRADHVGCYGYGRNTTPHIDRLARDAWVFKNAVSSAPWTTPSVASLLTSQYPSELGVREELARINPSFPLLSQILRRNGYTTCGIVTSPTLAASLGFDRGFDEYEEAYDHASTTHDDICSPAVTSKAIEFLRRKHIKPFFLFVHNFDPHYNYILHPEYDFYPAYTGSLTSGERIRELWKRLDTLSDDDVRYLTSLHDSEIAFTDEHIGKLLDELVRLGLYENTMVIVTADHGEEFMERGWLGHTVTLYQELIHVPLVVRVPGATAQQIDTSVGLVDVLPTVLAHANIEAPQGIEGQALSPEGLRAADHHPRFSETFNNQPRAERHREPIALRCVVHRGRKVIFDAMNDRTQCYDLSRDPLEGTDISGAGEPEMTALREKLMQWIDQMDRQYPAPSTTQDAQELFTPEQIKMLKSLGYL